MLLQSVPRYDDTDDTAEASRDWPDASYTADAMPVGMVGVDGWRVTHHLKGAPGIESLISEGSAVFAVEARCPATMHTKTFRPTNPAMPERVDVSLPLEMTSGRVDLLPGVLITEECKLDPAGTAWSPLGRIVVPVGVWLARAAPVFATPQGYEPLRFVPDDTIEPEDRFTIKIARTPDIRFEVRARKSRIEKIRHSRDLSGALLFVWATALAMLPEIGECEIEVGSDGTSRVPGSRMADMLLRELEAAGVTELWNRDEQGNVNEAWDPLAAASAKVHIGPHVPDLEDDQR